MAASSSSSKMDLNEDVRKEEKDLDLEEEEKLNDKFEEEQHAQAPLLILLGYRVLLQKPDNIVSATEKANLRNLLMEQIMRDKMGAYYNEICNGLIPGFKEDARLAADFKVANDEELKKLDDKIVEAKDKAGEVEVRDAMLARAEFFARIGDKTRALEAYEATIAKTVGEGGRIDIVFSIIRLALFTDDITLLTNNIGRAKTMVEKGGDWERRNLLNVYEATFLIITRRFKEAAKILLDATATFTCYKLYSYSHFVLLTVITSLVSLDRVNLRDKVVKNPDVLSSIRDVPYLRELLFALYNCQYADFFINLAAITPTLKRDPYIGQHVNYYLREVRIVAYSQFLESYRSVTLASMAKAFGVTEAFLDSELARFIASGRINCKIDKVGGIVETNRPDTKNHQYNEVIKQGDALLNRIQKLSKVIAY